MFVMPHLPHNIFTTFLLKITNDFEFVTLPQQINVDKQISDWVCAYVCMCDDRCSLLEAQLHLAFTVEMVKYRTQCLEI